MTQSPMNVRLVDNGNPPKVWIAHVSHEFKNGHHVFKSDSISGLFIAHQDPRKALAQLIPTITSLIFANTGENVRVFLGVDFKEFEREHCAADSSIKDTMIVIQKAA